VGSVIPFLDLKAQYSAVKADIAEAVARVLESGHYVLGPEVEAFEREFAAYCSAPHGIAVNSGTSALHLALLAAGIGPGDEVITTPFTFVATAAAVCNAGARPVFVDIRRDSFTIDPDLIEAAITPRTKALIPVHLYGQPAEMNPILDIARRHGLTVIEDACQAHGAEYEGRRAGSMGDLGCFSFYPGKNLGACGEGGLVVARDAEHAKKVRMLRDWGQERKYEHVLPGFNFRMDGIQGAILRVKLRRLRSGRRDAARRRSGTGDCWRMPASASPRKWPTRATSTTSTPCAPTIGARSRTRCRPNRSSRASTIRFRCTCSRPTRRSATARETSRRRKRPRARYCRCRCSPN